MRRSLTAGAEDIVTLDWTTARAVIETYLHGVDAKDEAELLGVFAEDAEALYHRGSADERRTLGRDGIVGEIVRSIARFTASNHSISNFTVKLNGDAARTDTFAIANVVFGTRMLVRGLRYQDLIVRTPAGPVIRERVHTPLWQTELATVPPKMG